MLMIHRRFLSWLGLTAGALMLAPASANVTLNLKEADISTLIATVSEVTGRNFIVDPRVRGKVTVIWTLVNEGLARIDWSESGGPRVTEPQKRGFGTDLIEKIVAHELRHPVELEFLPTGVRCKLLVPVREPNEFMLRSGPPPQKGH